MSCLGRLFKRAALILFTIVALVAIVRWSWADVSAHAKTWACDNVTHSLCEAP